MSHLNFFRFFFTICLFVPGLLTVLSAESQKQTEEKYLHDPHTLLSSDLSKDVEAFLAHHARESEIDLRLFIFENTQQESAYTDSLYKSNPGKDNSLAPRVHYLLKNPEKSSLHFSPALEKSIPLTERIQSLKHAIHASRAKEESGQQLEAFLIQLSIRVYWLERIMNGTADQTSHEMPEGEKLRIFPKKKKKKQTEAPIHLSAFLPVAIGSTAGLVLAAIVIWLFLKWRKRGTYFFPPYTQKPRLGAEYAAGIGSVISFSNSEESPSIQKKRITEL